MYIKKNKSLGAIIFVYLLMLFPNVSMGEGVKHVSIKIRDSVKFTRFFEKIDEIIIFSYSEKQGESIKELIIGNNELSGIITKNIYDIYSLADGKEGILYCLYISNHEDILDADLASRSKRSKIIRLGWNNDPLRVYIRALGMHGDDADRKIKDYFEISEIVSFIEERDRNPNHVFPDK